MTFNQEETGYEKTILSDLQGAWICLRESVVEAFGFQGSDRAIFHIDEAMSWEVVRDLRRMAPLLLIISSKFNELDEKTKEEVVNMLIELPKTAWEPTCKLLLTDMKVFLCNTGYQK